MKKHLISILILIVYIAILIRVMVFKDVPTIKIGQLMLNFGGTDGGHPANFVPFKTILPYLLGYKGWIIAGINLVGNIILLVPIGFLIPFVFPNITWKKSLALAVAAGLTIEIMQTILHVGIFDIDDVILNALGVMIGYFVFIILGIWMREKKYKNIIISVAIVVAAIVAFCIVYPHGQPVVHSGVDTGDAQPPQGRDLCGGTGGIGKISSLGTHTITIERKDGSNQIVTFTDRVIIETSVGPAFVSDLKIGDSVTLIGGPSPDGSFAADTILVCK